MVDYLMSIGPALPVLAMGIFCFWYNVIREPSAEEIERLKREQRNGSTPPETLL